MAFIEVDEIDFSEIIAEEFNKKQIVILKFDSEYCDACIALDFELEEIDDKYENVSVLAIDCGQSNALAERYGVTQVPTMIIFENKDSILWQKEGIMLAQDIEKIINL
ncbi:MAG: thioredoxin fold domain-containing protein [Sulfurimonas sp.]|nr:thioredoxin fold domain-containing protein [Sulfurimonas sp.]